MITKTLKLDRLSTNSKLGKLVLPICFVVLYGSGFVGAKYGLPDSSPLSFLTLRFFIAGLILLAVVKYFGIKFPKLKEIVHIGTAGSLTVATFSIGVFISIDLGLSPALSAIIIALQPILVGILAKYMVREELNKLQWIGLFLGLSGVFLVVSHNINMTTIGLYSILMSIVGLIGLTFGSLYQKKYCSNMNVFSGGMIQSITSGIICLVLLILFGKYTVNWTPEFISALSYMTVGVSIGALTLLYIMIQRSEVSKVSSIFYLVPVSAAISGYFLFNEVFDLITILGIIIVAIGVYLTNKG